MAASVANCTVHRPQCPSQHTLSSTEARQVVSRMSLLATSIAYEKVRHFHSISQRTCMIFSLANAGSSTPASTLFRSAPLMRSRPYLASPAFSGLVCAV